MFQDLVLKLVDQMTLLMGENKNKILFAGIATVLVLLCSFVLYRRWSKPAPPAEPMNVEDVQKRTVQFAEESYASQTEQDQPTEEEQNTQQE